MRETVIHHRLPLQFWRSRSTAGTPRVGLPDAWDKEPQIIAFGPTRRVRRTTVAFARDCMPPCNNHESFLGGSIDGIIADMIGFDGGPTLCVSETNQHT